MSDETILLKIKREFTKDESIGCLLQIISNLKIENGILISEKDELKHKLQNKEVLVNEDGKTKKVWMKEELIECYEKTIKNLKKEKEKLQKSLNKFRDDYYSLKILYDGKNNN